MEGALAGREGCYSLPSHSPLPVSKLCSLDTWEMYPSRNNRFPQKTQKMLLEGLTRLLQQCFCHPGRARLTLGAMEWGAQV